LERLKHEIEYLVFEMKESGNEYYYFKKFEWLWKEKDYYDYSNKLSIRILQQKNSFASYFSTLSTKKTIL